jgi:two-component system LytT family response regulator
MLKILIADDEKEARELILHYLKKRKGDSVIREVADGLSTVKELKEFIPDILFLDIEMPEMNGLQVLDQKEKTALPAIIFTTAYHEYALPAFDFEAIDYLLKPFEKQRFEKAMLRAEKYLTFIKNESASQYAMFLPVKAGGRTELIPVNEIEYFQAEGAYVRLITKAGQSYLIAVPLYDLEAKLDPTLFSRVHRSVILNLHSVKSTQSLLNGDHDITLQSGNKVRGSRTYVAVINRIKKLK